MPKRYYCILFFALLNFAPTIARTANFFVRANANGGNSGLDWSNAWSQMDQINYFLINPGDTIYIATNL